VEARSSSGVLLDPANLYRVLRRMRALRWIEEAEDKDDREERRRTHRITRQGRAILAAEVSRLERLLAQARPAVAGDG
jgi:DNA-binding PadR family transcriptional regulator